MTITNKVINCHLMESLPKSFFVNKLPDLSTKANFNSTLTLLRIPFCLSLFFTLIDFVVWIFFFYSGGGGGGGRGGIFVLEN